LPKNLIGGKCPNCREVCIQCGSSHEPRTLYRVTEKTGEKVKVTLPYCASCLPKPQYAYGHYIEIPPIVEELKETTVPDHTKQYLGTLIELLPEFDLDAKIDITHEEGGTALIVFRKPDHRLLFALEADKEDESGWVHVKDRGPTQILEDGPLEGTDIEEVLSLMFKQKEGGLH
jgi:hypothetical protein